MKIKEVRLDEKFQNACKSLGLNYVNSTACQNAIFVYDPENDTWFIMDKNYKIIGTDVLIKTDVNFQKLKLAHFVDFYLFDKFIVLETPTPGLYFLLDRNFNCFDAIRSMPDELNLERLASTRYISYETSFDDKVFNTFAPFHSFSLKSLLNIACRIDKVHFSSTTEESTIFLSINKANYRVSKKNLYSMMLCLIKFLGEISKIYFKRMYYLLVSESIILPPPLDIYINKVILEIYAILSSCKEESMIAATQLIICKLGLTDYYTELRLLVEEIYMLFKMTDFDLNEIKILADSCLLLQIMPDDAFRQKKADLYEVKGDDEFKSLFTNDLGKSIKFTKQEKFDDQVS